jgi:post-segregation antitoxin (ccd killing protein)
VKAEGNNASRVAEEALAQELERRRRADIEAEVCAGLAAINTYVEKHGSFADHVRDYNGEREGRDDPDIPIDQRG